MTCEVISSAGLVSGQRISVSSGAKCYNHRDTDAVIRIVGEISMGCAETYDYCKECHEQFKKEEQEVREAGETCDWCGKVKSDCKSHRDFEEGSNGPVYTVCLNCRLKHK